MSDPGDIILMPDAGPLITLGYADALELLFKPGWPLALADMVFEEVTRNRTPTSRKLAEWVEANEIPVLHTRIHRHYRQLRESSETAPRKANLGELAIQEVMNDFALKPPPKRGIFLFEDHKIARADFLLPENCRKVSTKAFLMFLEQTGRLDSAGEIERRAIRAGRNFSQLRFPLE